MAIKKKHFVNVTPKGELVFQDIVSWKQDCLNHKEKRCFVTIAKVVKHRSNQENRYAHGVVFPMMAEEMGCSMEEAKDALKFEFLRYQLPSGLWTVRQTSSLSTVEFEEFLSKCRMLASQMFNMYIGLPNEVEF